MGKGVAVGSGAAAGSSVDLSAAAGSTLARIFWEYGGERYSRQIAARVDAERRKERRIETTEQLPPTPRPTAPRSPPSAPRSCWPRSARRSFSSVRTPWPRSFLKTDSSRSVRFSNMAYPRQKMHAVACRRFYLSPFKMQSGFFYPDQPQMSRHSSEWPPVAGFCRSVRLCRCFPDRFVLDLQAMFLQI